MNYTHTPAYTLTTSLKKNIHQMQEDQNNTHGHIYNISGNLSHSNSCSFPKSQRKSIFLRHQETPAPDQYQPKKVLPHSPKNTFPKAKDINPENTVPPCTWYKPEEELIKQKTITYSMGQKYPSVLENKNNNPGPGHYENSRTPDVLTKSKSVTETHFTSAKRFSVSKEPIPGIGDYNIESTDFLKGKTTTIPKGQPYKFKSIPPGPSDYHFKSQFDHTVENQPGKTLSMRLKNPNEPQQYTAFAFAKYFQTPQKTLLTRRNSEKYTFLKSQRFLNKNSQQPGPTDYINDNIKAKNSYHSIIPKAKLQHFNDTVENPGPGTYQVNTTQIKSYSIGKSKSLTNLADTPGVGRYNTLAAPNKEKKGTAFPKSQRTSFASANLAGVGDYNIKEEAKPAKLGFSKAERFPRPEMNQPGPGDYHIHSIIGYRTKKIAK